MRILVAGAEGFIGRQIAAALRSSGHEVVAGVRRPADSHSIACDFARDLDPEVWVGRLDGIDAVVNAVGILRESTTNTFEAVHVAGPKALFLACQARGVRRIIQISALGDPDSGEYLASKHRGDDELARLGVEWTILRPSLVYSAKGSYGGTSLLRAMAALPGVLCVPGAGDQLLQPLCLEDLSLAVVRLIEREAGIRRIFSAVGPEPVSLLEYLRAMRSWLELPPAVVLHIPSNIAACGAWCGEHFGSGPLGMTMWRMLNRNNVATLDAAKEFAAVSGVQPQSINEMSVTSPSYVQDRWHARLYFLGPALRVALALLWIGSSAVGFLTPLGQSQALSIFAGAHDAWARAAVYGTSSVDLILGVLALLAWRPAAVAALMCISVVFYTLVIGSALPSMWLEPFGGLLKNLPLIPATLMMGVLAGRR